MSRDIESLKRQIRATFQDERKTTVRLSMDELEKLAGYLEEVAGLEGLLILSDRQAYVFLEAYPQVAFQVTGKRAISVESLQGLGFSGQFLGGNVQKRSFLRFLLEELQYHWMAVVITTLATLGFFVVQVETETYITIAQAALGVVALFVAVHLAFISLFYSSSQFKPSYYLSQLYSDFASNDRYVTYMAIWSIWLSMFAIFVGNVSYDRVVLPLSWRGFVEVADQRLLWLNRSNVLPVITGLNLLLIHLSLIAITEYYLERTRQERIQGAVQELRNDFETKLANSDVGKKAPSPKK